MKRGEYIFSSCGTPFCSGEIIYRCWLCGGVYNENCPCGDCGNYDACLCQGHIENWKQIIIKHILVFAKNLVKELVYAMNYGDWWWFTHGWRGK